jgi:nucleotide-binding universal stress UspA family protein
VSRPVLVGFDPRRPDWAPVYFGVEAARVTGARLIVAAVEAGGPEPPLTAGQMIAYSAANVDPDLVPDCRAMVDDVKATLHGQGIPAECMRLRGSSAARALHEAAERHDAVLLAIGARRGRGPLGSTAVALMHGSPCPVAVVPSEWGEGRPLRVIGAAYVDSEEAREALRGAYALARRAGARLRVLSVVDDTPQMYLETETYKAGQFGKDLEDVEGEHKLWTERHLRRVVAELGDDVPIEIEVVVGKPADSLSAVSSHLDLLAMGARGYGPLRAVLLGSVSRRVTAAANCPVVVLPRGDKAPLEALVEAGRQPTNATSSTT